MVRIQDKICMNTETIKMHEFGSLYFYLCSNKNRDDIQVYGHLF
jgi:hypothetical protein